MLGALDLDADKRAFVDAVMEPLGDDAPRRKILEDCLGMAESFPRPSQGDPMAIATERMRNSARGFTKSRGVRVAAWSAMVLVAAWFAVAGLPALRSLDRVLLANRMSSTISTMCCEHGDIPSFPYFLGQPDEVDDVPSFRRALERIAPEKRLILEGDHRLAEVPRWKAVWDRYPEQAAHYFAYALAHLKEHERWPEDLLARGEKLDPQNGWFRAMAGTDLLKSAIGEPKPPKLTPSERRALAKVPSLPKPKRVILDQTAFDRAFDLLGEALVMPRWYDYTASLDRIRFEVTPAPEDFSEYAALRVVSSVQPEDLTSAAVCFRAYTEAFAFAADKAAKEGDRARLEALDKTFQRAAGRLAEMEGPLVNSLVLRNFVVADGRKMAAAWKSLGDSAHALPYELAANALDPKLTKPPAPAPDALDQGRGSGFVSKGYIGRRRAHSSFVTEPELRSGRLAEYALYERFMVHGGAVMLFVVAIFLGIAWRSDRKRLGSLPARLTGLLRVQDHGLILLLGVGLPLALYVISTRAGYPGVRDYALGADSFILWVMQMSSVVIAVLLVSVLVTRWRLSRRAPMLAIGGRWMSPEVWVAVLALGMIPVATVLPKLLEAGNGILEMLAWTSAGFMAGLPLIWLLYLAACQVAGNPELRLHRALLTRGVAWPVALAMVIAAGAVYGLHQEEKHWVARMGYDALSEKTNMFSLRGDWEEAEGINSEVKRKLESLK